MLKNKNESFFLVLIIALYIIIRTINFPYHLNFSYDQAWFSSEALNIYKTGKQTLIGPHISFMFDGRKIFQGSVTYYFQLIFLVLGNFDPVKSSYYLLLFSSLMIIPLYFGVEFLINRRSAIIIVIIFTLLPYYINYTRFFWNPNFLFILSPLLIFLMGTYNKYKSTFYFFLISLLSGILTLFHFQFFLIISGILIYYFFIKKIGWKLIPLFTAGFLLGFSELIVFDLRNNLYNLRTFLFFLQNLHSVVNTDQTNIFAAPHYFLTISLFLIIVLLAFINKVFRPKIILTASIILLIWSISIYSQKPSHGYGMTENWNYLDEDKAHKIIVNQNLENYNIVNLIYNTDAMVQKYLLKKDGIEIDFDNYKSNHYLFVLCEGDKYVREEAYEVKYFKPIRLLKTWIINSKYNLYLLEKVV